MTPESLARAHVEPRSGCETIRLRRLELEAANLHPLWDRFRTLTPVTPQAKDPPLIWRWRDIEPFTERAVREVPIDDVERRALILVNPAFGGETVTTHNLIAAFTVLDPGDRARPHRHTFAAIRFATRADGAATIVNGRRCEMKSGDLILTPPMCWHGHINESDHRIIWFDAANIPLIRQLDANFFEPGDPRANQFWQVDEGDEKLWAEAGMVGADVPRSRRIRRNTITPARRPAGCWPPCPPGPDGARTMRYTNPATGGAVMPALDCYAVRLPKGAGHAAEAHDLQHDLSGGVRRGPLDRGRAHVRLVAERRVLHPALELGEPHRQGRRRRPVHRLRQGRRSSASTCCGRNCNKRPSGNRARGHRRVGTARRGPEIPARSGLLCRRHRVAGRIALRAGALAARPRTHPRHRHRPGQAAAGRRRRVHWRRHGGRQGRSDGAAMGDPIAPTASRWPSRRALRWRAARSATSAKLWLRWSPKRARRRRTPPTRSRWIMRCCPR